MSQYQTRRKVSVQQLEREPFIIWNEYVVKIRSAKELAETALEGEFDEYDQAFYACQPTITELLQAYLEVNEAEFIERMK
jgi:hypothetical protein